MAHNINTYIGRSAAWHTLGTVTGKYQTTDELLSDPGFQYIVLKSQLRDGLGRPVDAYGTFRWDLKDKVNGNKEAAQFLGTVGKDYAVIQHDEGFKSIDAIMRTASVQCPHCSHNLYRESEDFGYHCEHCAMNIEDSAVIHGAHYETAGVLGNGERVWALADLGFAAKVGEDVQKGYLLFSTGHDGSMAHSYRICFTRVVCQNTLGIALSERTKAALTIRHTKNAMGRLVEARSALDSMGTDVKRVEDRLNFLAGKKMNREALTSIMDRLFPKKVTLDGATTETTRRTNILADVLKLYEVNDGNAFPEQRGTAYNLLNAITNYVDHERSSKEDGRAESAMFGSGDVLKSKALEVISETARNLEAVPSRLSIPVDWSDLGLQVQ